MDQWSPQTRKAGTQRSNRRLTARKLNSHAQSHTQTCRKTSSRKLQHPQHCLGRLRRPFFFQLCNLLTLLSIWEVERKEKDTFGRDAGFPLGPEAVPARHYCLSQRSQRKAWRHYRESRRRRGPVNCDNHEEVWGFFFQISADNNGRTSQEHKNSDWTNL